MSADLERENPRNGEPYGQRQEGGPLHLPGGDLPVEAAIGPAAMPAGAIYEAVTAALPDPHIDSPRLVGERVIVRAIELFRIIMDGKELTPLQREELEQIESYDYVFHLARLRYEQGLFIRVIARQADCSVTHVRRCLTTFNALMGLTDTADACVRMIGLIERVIVKGRYRQVMNREGLSETQKAELGLMEKHNADALRFSRMRYEQGLTINETAEQVGCTMSYVSHCLDTFKAWMGLTDSADAHQRMNGLIRYLKAKGQFMKVLNCEGLSEDQIEELRLMEKYNADALSFMRMRYEESLTLEEIARRGNCTVKHVTDRLYIFYAWMGLTDSQNAQRRLKASMKRMHAKWRFEQVMRSEGLNETQIAQLKLMKQGDIDALRFARDYYGEGLTKKEIAEKEGCSFHHVRYRLRDFNARLGLSTTLLMR